VFRGKLGREVDVAAGQAAAQLTILNLLASLKAEIGELDRVKRVVKLLVLVNSDPEFDQQPTVANGASDLLVAVFGPERGSHARSAIGMGALPFKIPVEIEAIFELGS
jgi:enamine deaminase RidA (YjgF/YER057c/UK114 family)